jgi:mRNA interferase MazF
MERPVIGSIIVVNFPFSDLTKSKLRPAIVLAEVDRDDWIFCQVTSKPYSDPFAIEIDTHSFMNGKLPKISYVRPGKIFTGNISLITKIIGQLNFLTISKISNASIDFFQRGLNEFSEN